MPKGLGNADIIATKAPAGATNAGNWTATFNPRLIGISQAEYECYRIVIKGGPPASTFNIYVGTKLYDSVMPGDTNSWDPNQPMKLVQGDTVYFYWNTGSGSSGPEVWMYFQEPEVL